MKDWIVIGHHSIRESVEKRPKDVKNLWLAEAGLNNRELSELFGIAKKLRVPTKLVGDKKLNQLIKGHQGAVLETRALPPANWSQISTKAESLVLALDGIEDPHNLGAILRTAWLMEVDAILIPKDRSVKLTPTALKIASGGAEHVPLEVETNLNRKLSELKEAGYWVSGLAEGGRDRVDQWEPEEKVVIVVGAEGDGLRKSTRENCDRIMEIWQTPSGSSYNASVAAALAMSQYRFKKLTK